MPEPEDATVAGTADEPVETAPVDEKDAVDVSEYEKDLDEAKADWEKDKVGPPPGSARWNAIYWKAKEADRKAEELNERKKDIEAMRRHNEELMEVLKENAKKPEPAMKQEPEPDASIVKAQIQALRAQKAKATAEFDFDKVAELEDKIDDLKDSLRKPEKKEDAGAAVTQAMKKKEIDDHFNAWLKEAPWYDSKNEAFDEAMAAYAERIWGRVTKGVASYAEALKKVQDAVEEKFSYKKEKTPQGNTPKPPNVAGAAGGANRETPPKAQLNEDERRVARNMFPDDPKGEEKYLAQKLEIAKRKGGK